MPFLHAFHQGDIAHGVGGTQLDITLAELASESFFPADAATQETLQQLSSVEQVR